MSPLVRSTDSDDPNFIAIVNSLACGMGKRLGAPDELWIIHIDNWFDHKWLKFSGTGRLNSPWELPNRIFTYRVEFFGGKGKLNFPPFSPKRVLGQWSFIRRDDGYSEVAPHTKPHPAEKRPSETNLYRTVQEFSQSASFLWYSGNTLANGKGSVMVYSVWEGLMEAWFAAFVRQREWRLNATKGVSRELVEALLQIQVSNER